MPVPVRPEVYIDEDLRVAQGELYLPNALLGEPRYTIARTVNNIGFSDQSGNTMLFTFENGRFDIRFTGNVTSAAQLVANHILQALNAAVEDRIREVRQRYESGDEN